jgi:cyclohexadienyl dehydratase
MTRAAASCGNSTGFRRTSAAVWMLVLAATAGRADAPAEAPALRVGTSGDYAPFSLDPEGPAPLGGLDVALAQAFASEHGERVEWVRFAWPELERRLTAGDFDVAMSGVTVRPDRSLVGRFTAPIAESGAVVLVRAGAPATALDALDGPGVTLAVNAGGHLERVTRARFPKATVHAIADNAAVLAELLEGRADGVITDTLEAPAWQERAPGLLLLGPFTHDRKAWLVRAEALGLAAELDAWLAAKEADGTLAAARAQWLPTAARASTAAPLPALVAAMDERLGLAPVVAQAKRASGRPVRDAAQEARVLDAAVTDASKAALAAGSAGPSEDCVRGLTRAQIDAGSAIQEAVLARPSLADGVSPPDLERAVRPALARIGPRIAAALVRLPTGGEPEALRHAVRDGLRAPDLDASHRDAIVEAVLRCATATRP